MNKEQLSQLVQDVIDGKESAVKAKKIILEYKSFLTSCHNAIFDYIIKEISDGSTKDRD